MSVGGWDGSCGTDRGTSHHCFKFEIAQEPGRPLISSLANGTMRSWSLRGMEWGLSASGRVSLRPFRYSDSQCFSVSRQSAVELRDAVQKVAGIG